MLRTNLMLWLHAAFPGPSEVPWQQFSQLYWYQKGCQEGFHGPNVREMAQNTITCTTDRLQQLPVWGANWYPLVWNQDSQGQLLQHCNLEPHAGNVESSPVHTTVFWGLWRQCSASSEVQLLTPAPSTKGGNFSTKRRLITGHQTEPTQPRNSQLLESHVTPLLSHSTGHINQNHFMPCTILFTQNACKWLQNNLPLPSDSPAKHNSHWGKSSSTTSSTAGGTSGCWVPSSTACPPSQPIAPAEQTSTTSARKETAAAHAPLPPCATEPRMCQDGNLRIIPCVGCKPEMQSLHFISLRAVKVAASRCQQANRKSYLVHSNFLPTWQLLSWELPQEGAVYK